MFTALSRTEALFDCLVGGDWPLALEIHDLSPLSWMPDGEYEESYCYHRLIHAYVAEVLGRGAPGRARDWQRRLEVIVADIPEAGFDIARLQLCTRFLAGEEEQFWSAFDAFVETSGDAAAAVPLADVRLSEFPWLATERHVSIELLAWMTLARSRQFRPPQREYTRCPSVAWLNGRVEAASDLFLQLESRFSL